MADPFIAEVRIFPFNFAPRGWAFCDGQILPISQNTALFSLLGTNYGGNGQSTFALPNLQGRVALGSGQGPGLSNRALGETGGAASVALTEADIPNHTHSVGASNQLSDTPQPAGNTPARYLNNAYQLDTNGNLVSMAPEALPSAGGGQPHNNLMPYLTFNFCIALQGLFPPRT